MVGLGEAGLVGLDLRLGKVHASRGARHVAAREIELFLGRAR